MGSKAWVTLGEVTRVRGLKGEMVVRPWSDKISRFTKLKEVYLGQNEPKVFKVVLARKHSGHVFLRLAGITTPAEASLWVKSLVRIPLDELPGLAKDQYYPHELIGCQVFTEEQESLGELKEVLANPGTDLLLVRDEKREFYIPATKEAVVKVDSKHRKIIVKKSLAVEQ